MLFHTPLSLPVLCPLSPLSPFLTTCLSCPFLKISCSTLTPTLENIHLIETTKRAIYSAYLPKCHFSIRIVPPIYLSSVLSCNRPFVSFLLLPFCFVIHFTIPERQTSVPSTKWGQRKTPNWEDTGHSTFLKRKPGRAPGQHDAALLTAEYFLPFSKLPLVCYRTTTK